MVTVPARKNPLLFGRCLPALFCYRFQVRLRCPWPWLDNIEATLSPWDLKIVLATDQEATRPSLCFASLVWKTDFEDTPSVVVLVFKNCATKECRKPTTSAKS
jgi:hypothetical protein